MDYSQIGPHLYLGESPKTAADYEELVLKFAAVIEFNHSDDFSKHRLKDICKDDPAILSMVQNALDTGVVQHFQYYLDDHVGYGAVDQYRKALKDYMHIAPTDDTIIHCKSGVHRSAHFIIYMWMLVGFAFDEAFDILHNKRPVIEMRPSLRDQLLYAFGESHG